MGRPCAASFFLGALANAAPLPIAATIAIEMIGPITGTVITLRELIPACATDETESQRRCAASGWCRNITLQDSPSKRFAAPKSDQVGAHQFRVGDTVMGES
jgi:hypothetical protein